MRSAVVRARAHLLTNEKLLNIKKQEGQKQKQ